MVPKTLQTWFKLHFFVDYLIAIPLFLFPTKILTFLDLQPEPLTARLVACALFAIGGISLIKHKKEAYKVLLNLKILWSLTAIIALTIALIQTANIFITIPLIAFLVFLLVWIYYKTLLN